MAVMGREELMKKLLPLLKPTLSDALNMYENKSTDNKQSTSNNNLLMEVEQRYISKKKNKKLK